MVLAVCLWAPSSLPSAPAEVTPSWEYGSRQFFTHPGHLALARALASGHVAVAAGFGGDTAIGVDGGYYWGNAPGFGALYALGIRAVGETIATRAVPLAAVLLLYGALVWAGVDGALAALLLLTAPLSFYTVLPNETLLSAATVLVAAEAEHPVVQGVASSAILLTNFRLAPLTLLACASRRSLLAALPLWALVAVWNTICFGAPWAWGVAHIPHFPGQDLGTLFGVRSVGDGLVELLVASAPASTNPMGEARYGLLAVAPWLALAPLGWLAVRRFRLWGALGLSWVTVLLFATLRSPTARYLAPLVPLWLTPLLRRRVA